MKQLSQYLLLPYIKETNYLLIPIPLGHRETITALNIHAAILASNTRRGTEIFYEQFIAFIKLFQSSNFDPSYLEGNPTPVTNAYWVFQKCCKEEVVDIDSKNVD